MMVVLKSINEGTIMCDHAEAVPAKDFKKLVDVLNKGTNMCERDEAVPAKDFNKLVDVLSWYQKIPLNVTFPDSFHESVDDTVNRLLPIFPEVVSGAYYISSVDCSVGGDVFVSLWSNDFECLRGDNRTIIVHIIPS